MRERERERAQDCSEYEKWRNSSENIHIIKHAIEQQKSIDTISYAFLFAANIFKFYVVLIPSIREHSGSWSIDKISTAQGEKNKRWSDWTNAKYFMWEKFCFNIQLLRWAYEGLKMCI